MKLVRFCLALFLLLPLPVLANEDNNTTTTTTTTISTTTTTTIPEGEVEEVETFDGTTTTTTIPEETTTTSSSTTTTTTSSTTTTTVPETWEQSTDIVLPEDELDTAGNEVENNIVIDNIWSGKYGCTDFCMNLEYQQHGGDGEYYSFDLPDDHEIYEVGFVVGAVNNNGTVTYTHTDETTQTDTISAQQYVSDETMYEEIVYNIRTSLDTFIDSFTIYLNDWSLLDDISFKYVTTTTTVFAEEISKLNKNVSIFPNAIDHEEKQNQ